jgi:beta-galactosidase GanA
MTQDLLTREVIRLCTGTYQQLSYINQQKETSARNTGRLKISNLESFTVLCEKVFYFGDAVQSI